MPEQSDISLAEYAPRTYRRLNPNTFKRIARQLISDETPSSDVSFVLRAVVEDIVRGVRNTDEPIKGMDPDNFAARLIQKTGLVAVSYLLTHTDSSPVIKLNNDYFVIDLTSQEGLARAESWRGLK